MKPDFPNRMKLCGMGLGIGIALGTLLAGGTEYLDDRLYDEKELKAQLPVTVMSEIPQITGPEEERKQLKTTVGDLGNCRFCLYHSFGRVSHQLLPRIIG